jgi:hypothetical protein
MRGRWIALAGTVLVCAVWAGARLVPAAVGAPVVTPHYQPVVAQGVNTTDKGVVAMLWLLADDGKLKLCEGTTKGNLTVTCSPPVQP